MLRDAAVSIIKSRLGNRTDLDSDIVIELQVAQTELELELDPPWFLVQKTTTLQNQASPNLDLITLPTDFIQEVEGAKLWWSNVGTWTPIDRALDYADTQEAELTNYTVPSFYTILGLEAQLTPTPVGQITLRWWYYAQAVVLSANVENAWLKYAPEVLISRTGLKMAPYLKDKEASASFAQSYKMALAALVRMNEARKVSGQDLSMSFGGPDT